MVSVKQKTRVVDFSDVRDRGPFSSKHHEEGDYRFKIIDVLEDEHDGDPRYTYALQMVDDPKAVYPYRCKLITNQLWKLRNIFIAAGKKAPKSRVKVDFTGIVGMEIGGTCEDDEYEGKLRSTVDSVFPVEELAEEEEAPRKKAPAKKTASSKKPEPDEDEDEDEDEDDEDLDLETL